MSKILELARKLQALAEQGVGGEKVNAKKMLDKLCEKHGITEEQLGVEQKSEEVFKYTYATSQIMLGCIGKVCGEDWPIYQKKRKYRAAYFATVSRAQYLEILSLYDFYSRDYKRVAEKFELAYIVKNSLHPTYSQKEEPEEEPDRKPDFELAAMHEAIQPATFRKQLKK